MKEHLLKLLGCGKSRHECGDGCRRVSSLDRGQCGRIVSIEGGAGRRRKLMALGVAPGRRFRFVRGGRFEPICLSIEGAELMLGSGMGDSILVKTL